MILKNQPLCDYVREYREAGLDVAALPATTNPKRFVIRLVDPDDHEMSGSYLASFANALKEADRPDDDHPREQTLANRKLDAMLNDEKQMSKYTVCYCIVDEDSLLKFPGKYTAKDMDKQFITVTRGTVKSDSYREYDESVAETAADAKPKRTRSARK